MLNYSLDFCLMHKYSKMIIITKTPLHIQIWMYKSSWIKNRHTKFFYYFVLTRAAQDTEFFLGLLGVKKEIQTTTVKKSKSEGKIQGFTAFERNPNGNYRLIFMMEIRIFQKS